MQHECPCPECQEYRELLGRPRVLRVSHIQMATLGLALLIILLACSGCARPLSQSDEALLGAMDNLKVAVPLEVSADCEVPPIPQEAEAVRLHFMWDYSLRQEEVAGCERLRKREAAGIVSKMNAAVDNLKERLAGAIRESKIKTGPFDLW